MTVLNKRRMLLKTVFCRMFQNQPTIGFQQLAGKDHIGNLRQFFQRVGWIGKNYIKARLAFSYKIKNISFEKL